jgi:hypothetical protein
VLWAPHVARCAITSLVETDESRIHLYSRLRNTKNPTVTSYFVPRKWRKTMSNKDAEHLPSEHRCSDQFQERLAEFRVENRLQRGFGGGKREREKIGSFSETTGSFSRTLPMPVCSLGDRNAIVEVPTLASDGGAETLGRLRHGPVPGKLGLGSVRRRGPSDSLDRVSATDLFQRQPGYKSFEIKFSTQLTALANRTYWLRRSSSTPFILIPVWQCITKTVATASCRSVSDRHPPSYCHYTNGSSSS